MHFEKFPPQTPRWLVWDIFYLGGALGAAIIAESLAALYGLSAFFNPVFFPGSGFPITVNEATALGIIGAITAAAGAGLIMTALGMNNLSKSAIAWSRFAFLATLLSACVITANHFSIGNNVYSFSKDWVVVAWLSFVLGGILPYALLSTSAARKLHTR